MKKKAKNTGEEIDRPATNRQTDRQTDRKRNRDRHRHREGQRDRQTDRQTDRDRLTEESVRESERKREKERERERAPRFTNEIDLTLDPPLPKSPLPTRRMLGVHLPVCQTFGESFWPCLACP